MLALGLGVPLALGHNGVGLLLGIRQELLLLFFGLLFIGRAAGSRTAYEEQAEKEKQQLLADAQKQADAIVAEGKRNAEAERQHKLREADAQTTALAREMCEKLLARNLTQQDDARLLDDLLQKAGVDDGN